MTPVSASRAAEDNELLQILGRELIELRIRFHVYLRLRVREDGKELPVGEKFNPTEMVVFGPDGEGRATVTIRRKVNGDNYWVTPADKSPEWKFALSQAQEAAAYLAGLVRGYNVAPDVPATP